MVLRLLVLMGWLFGCMSAMAAGRPNILLIISDDQSWEHTSFAGYPAIQTPNFDRLAHQGVYFERAYVAAPTCGASRASILTGRHIWGLESAAMLWGYWPEAIPSYQDVLAKAGYHTGYTGKPWGPGYVRPGTRQGVDPTGVPYVDRLLPKAPGWRGVWDLAANFEAFLDARPAAAPFSFIVGAYEPHRPFPKGDVSRFTLLDARHFLPPNLPDTPQLRKDLAAYLQEVELYDADLGRIMDVLQRRGFLDNTLVVVTSDNGIDVARAKTTNYEYGVRVPLVMVWPDGLHSPGRRLEGVVSLVDLAPTFLQVAGVSSVPPMDGQSLLPLLQSSKAVTGRDAVFTAYERHAGFIREFNATYPRRAIHTPEYVLIRNYFPDRWAFGDPPRFIEAGTYFLRDAQDHALEPFYSLATTKKPYEELYVLADDPGQLHNRIDDPALTDVRNRLRARLDAELEKTADPVHTQRIDYFGQFEYLGPKHSATYPTPGATRR
ncbi:MAG TPA: sulfatase [Pseudomonadales bacterium]